MDVGHAVVELDVLSRVGDRRARALRSLALGLVAVLEDGAKDGPVPAGGELEPQAPNPQPQPEAAPAQPPAFAVSGAGRPGPPGGSRLRAAAMSSTQM